MQGPRSEAQAAKWPVRIRTASNDAEWACGSTLFRAATMRAYEMGSSVVVAHFARQEGEPEATFSAISRVMVERMYKIGHLIDGKAVPQER